MKSFLMHVALASSIALAITLPPLTYGLATSETVFSAAFAYAEECDAVSPEFGDPDYQPRWIILEPLCRLASFHVGGER